MTIPLVPVDDVGREIDEILNIPVHPDRITLVSEHPDYPGTFYFDVGDDPDDRQGFFDAYKTWVSRHLILNELFQLGKFSDKLTEDGWHLVFDPSTKDSLADYHRWSTPLQIGDYDLLDYQNFSLNKALERHEQGRTTQDRLYFWNWSAGAGKSFCSGAAVKALFDSDQIDLVIACTLSKLKINLCRFLEHAGIDAVVNDGEPVKRARVYHEGHQAYVMNFEKLRVDENAIRNMVTGKRVLFILDEAHKVISDGASNQSRKALDKLTRLCESTVWPMSATVVGGNPLRFRDVFSLDGHPRSNPLGTKENFVATYARSVKTVPAKTRSGGTFMFTRYDWDLGKLAEVRHRVHDRTMAVRVPSKLPVIPLPIQPTPQLLRVFEAIIDKAREARDRGEGLAPYYRLLRQTAVTPAALAVADDPIAAEIHAEHPELCMVPSPKLEVLNGLLEEISEAQDQAVCFVKWTTGGLHMLSPHLAVKHVDHWGAGQTTKASQKAQDDFKADPSIVAFLSSDAGAHGLNFQNARYVINIDPLYDYDIFTQRNRRIDRADSHLEDLTGYVLLVEDSVEMRVWQVCNLRMCLAAATQGTVEALSSDEEALALVEEDLNLEWLIFGDER